MALYVLRVIVLFIYLVVGIHLLLGFKRVSKNEKLNRQTKIVEILCELADHKFKTREEKMSFVTQSYVEIEGEIDKYTKYLIETRIRQCKSNYKIVNLNS